LTFPAKKEAHPLRIAQNSGAKRLSVVSQQRLSQIKWECRVHWFWIFVVLIPLAPKAKSCTYLSAGRRGLTPCSGHFLNSGHHLWVVPNSIPFRFLKSPALAEIMHERSSPASFASAFEQSPSIKLPNSLT